MTISIETFGGNKDAYYNFKQNLTEARNRLHLADLYLSPIARDTIGELVDLSLNSLRDIEFGE